MNTKVLLLAAPADLHAEAVRAQLKKLNVPYEQWAISDILQQRFAMKIQTASWHSRVDRTGESSLSFESFSSIWLRRPGVVRTSAMPEAWVEAFIRNETTAAMEAVFRMMPGFWVNNPAAQRESTYKLHQLGIASKSGFVIPKTLVTNDPEAIASFCEECGGPENVIYKQIDERSGHHFPRYQSPRGLPTQQLSAADLPHIDQVSRSAHLFQEKIEKVSDVRVTVVGQRVFAAEILSQTGKGNLDFRLDYSVPVQPFDLPTKSIEACRELLSRLRLEFGAVDLCRTADDNFVFLEVNAAGQYLWLENALGLPISEELARLLAGLSPPLNGRAQTHRIQ